MATSRLEFRILGSLTLRVDGVAVPAGGPKQRALLALLLLNANRVVSRDRLVDELFPDQSVSSADHALRNHISRLRKLVTPLGPDEPRLVASAPGYLFRVEPGELDLDAFEELAEEGRDRLAAGDAAAAVESLRAAEGLWRGRPLADLEFEPFARLDVERLEELRLGVVEARIDAELALGRHRALVPDLEGLAAEHPLRERFRAQLMLALYRSGRQAESLDVYQRSRRLLDEQLGLAPAAELQELERAILVQDPALDVMPALAAQPPLPVRKDVCPFKGLAPFEAADVEFFFGRERLIEEIVTRLAETPLLAIVGASGSGKSSLLGAGLLPALARGVLPGSERWQQVLLRPGNTPSKSLLRALGTDLPSHIEGLSPGERVVVAVDQTEELFGDSVAEDERRAFIAQLVESTWDADRRAVVLLVLRGDFVADVAPYGELSDLVSANQVLVRPMSGGELRRTIERPAERVGLNVEPELVDELVGEVSGEVGGLPLLETALLGLWLARSNHVLTLEAYERAGGVRGAVNRFAENVYEILDGPSRDVARRLLVRLVAGGDGEPVTRRRLTQAEIAVDADDRADAVLSTLINQRLLVAHDDSVELVHEALLEHWDRFVGWLAEDSEDRRLRGRLARSAAEWDAAGRDPSELMRGGRLAAALEWAESAPVSGVERTFLEESRLAAARDSERQRRANRRLRALLAAAVAMLVVAIASGAVALEKRGQARRQATAAEAQRLGAQALIQPSLDRSLLLAREAVKLDDSFATRSYLLDALLRAPAAVAVAHEGTGRLLDEALTPDGRRLAVRGEDGNVVIFDTRTMHRVAGPLIGDSQIGLFGSIKGPLHALAFSPDGKTLAIGSTDGSAGTVDLMNARLSRAIDHGTGLGSIAADVAFAPDGRELATGEPVAGPDQPPSEIVVVRNPRTAVPLRESREIAGGRLAGYTANGRYLLVTSGPNASLLLDSRTLKPVRRLTEGAPAALSPAGDLAAFGHSDGSLVLVDLRTGRETPLSGRGGASIESLNFSADGKAIATAAADGTVAVWDVPAKRLREQLTGHSSGVQAAVFSPDARSLYSASLDGSVIAWDLAGARRLGRPFRIARDGSSGASAVSPDGSEFAVASESDHLELRRTETLAVGRTLRGPVGYVNDVDFSQDGLLLAAAGSSHAVVWDLRTGKVARVFPVGEHGANAIALSPDRHTLAVGLAENVVALFDLRTGTLIMSLPNDGSPVKVDFSPDGRLLASAGLEGNVQVWQVVGRKLVATLGGDVADFSVRFSPDGKLLAVGASSGTVVLWDVATKARVGRSLAGHAGGVFGVAFDPSGRKLVSFAADGKLRLWDVATQRLIGAPLPVSSAYGSVAFFPDGRHVLGVFGSGDAVLWNVDPTAWARQACNTANRNLTPAEWDDFLPNRAYRRVCP